ncbi:hypothetical protein Hanom_Chr06g00538581 [Helianthus anomalus]
MFVMISKHIFIEYLELVKHQKAVVMHRAIIQIESLAWSTTRRGASPNVDSAIFVMRHGAIFGFSA